MMYYNSRYNFRFPTEDGFLLYNSKTGATVNFNGADSEALLMLLSGDKVCFSGDHFDERLLQSFLHNGFVVEENRDELLEIRERYWKARGSTPIVLTITTTMDCNLGCYYCYESRTKHRLTDSDIDEMIEGLRQTFSKNPKRSLHVDWYGGEPLLNLNFLRTASQKLQEFCRQHGINFHASIISNGTVWPENVEEFIATHKIRQVQISFDGLKENHNRRRRYRNKSGIEDNSFDTIVSLVDRLLDHVHVDVRINIDWKNQHDVEPLLDLFAEKGWFNRKYPAVVQPARISSYSEKSAFLEKKQLSLQEFDAIREMVRKKMKGITTVEESEVPDGYPFPKTFVCAALANESSVVGADKLIYRCGLQVGEAERAVGRLGDESEKVYDDAQWWNAFDPTTLPSCSRCSFLPVCFGGCPKKHLEHDQIALEEQSQYWRQNLQKKVVGYLNVKSVRTEPLQEKDQFRLQY